MRAASHHPASDQAECEGVPVDAFCSRPCASFDAGSCLQLILPGNALWGSEEVHAADGSVHACLHGNSLGSQGPSISVQSGQVTAELLGERSSYAPGRSLRLLDAASRAPVASVAKQLASGAPAVQRSLLAQREELRASQVADQETFTLVLEGGPSFSTQRTYPGLEVSVCTGSGAAAASLSCHTDVAACTVWLCAPGKQRLDLLHTG